MTYPRTKNGWTDNGQKISGARKHCPNCSSTNYQETLSRESCNDCGLEMDYWTGSGNAVYQSYLSHHYRLQEEQAQARYKAEMEREWNDNSNRDSE